MLTLRERGEEGATAVLVGVLSLLLFMMAGLAVDLGNAWARGRTVQKQVDVSALSVGYRLPMRSAAGHTEADIAEDVARQLVRNGVLGQPNAFDATRTETALATALKADLLDAQPGNGDLQFFASTAAAAAATTECATGCPVMRVIAPQAEVEFGFAGAIEGVGGSTTVQREATVAVESALPPRQKLIPFWLPSGCGYGPTHADTQQGGGNGAAAPARAWTMPRAAAGRHPSSLLLPGTAPSPTPVGDHVLGGAAKAVTAGSTTTLNGYSVTGVGNQYKKVSLRAFRPDGKSYVDFSAQTTGDGALPSMQVGPSDITGTVGDWYLFALAAKANDEIVYSSNSLKITVTGVAPTPTPTPTATPSETATAIATASATPSPTGTASASASATPTVSASPSPSVTGIESGCVGQDRGNFGKLESPREGVTLVGAFDLNIALGMDHTLVPYRFPSTTPETKECGSGATLLPGAKLDEVAGTAGNGTNCIKGGPGDAGPKTLDGLLRGVGTHPGRLDRANGATTCPERSDVAVGGKLINNDSLACFLRNGATKASIAADDGVDTSMLDPAIVKSPRFVYLPVVYASDRAQKEFQPIRNFVPGFITEETVTRDISEVTSAVNGVEMQGNSFKTLHVFTFNPGALPPTETAETTAYDPDVNASIVRLVG